MTRAGAITVVFAGGAVRVEYAPGRPEEIARFLFQDAPDDGALVPDAGYDLIFTLWDAPTDGTALWTETHNAVAVVRGGFNVVLGSVTPLTLEFDKPMWLGVAVASDPEMSPRVPLTASPYALGMRLPFIGAGSSGTPLVSLQNSGSGPALFAPVADRKTAERVTEQVVLRLGELTIGATPYVARCRKAGALDD